MTGFGFQLTSRTVQDLRVRQAVNFAIDRKKWVRAAGGSDEGRRVIGFVHPFREPILAFGGRNGQKSSGSISLKPRG
ncbi:MAG: hypothetical protein M5U21_13370 [Fimbriimonadaceae bacterium]|nr:hypothetical protein [Fimbriimonadaceae bacterium]